MMLPKAGAQERYDMPVGFGPSPVPTRSTVPNSSVAGISFLTDAARLRAITPDWLQLEGDPVVTLSFIDYPAVDYLGGRGYHEAVLSFPTRFKSDKEEITGGYAPVLWVSESGALIAGREFMGLPKLLGSFIPGKDETSRSFACAEFGATLFKGRAYDLKPLSEEQVAKVRARSQEVRTFGWKYIPAAGGGVDCDYPLVNVMRWEYERAWTGQGEVEFLTPDATAAPFSSRIMAYLAALPVLEWRRSFVAEGKALIDRTGTRRIG